MKRNSPFPSHMWSVETALDWALSNSANGGVGFSLENDLPPSYGVMMH